MSTLQTSSTPYASGRRGDKLRGDVWLGFTPASSGGLQLEFHSRVEGLYGASTRSLLLDLLASAGIQHGSLEVQDAGAYPFILRARMESLLIAVSGDPSFRVPPEPSLGAPMTDPEAQRQRRSRLYLPGNEPKYMLSAALHHPDAIILDLEDSVAPAAKADARALVRHALFHLDWGTTERMVRINQGAMGLEDLAYLAAAPFHLLLLPKVEEAQELQALEPLLSDRPTLLMPILETAKGVLHAESIAQGSTRVVALTLGLEDLTADLGVAKTDGGKETLWARSQVVFAARACGLQAIDSVYGNFADEAGLRSSLREAKALGFEGKGCVHPRQIRIVHEELAPDAKAIDRACHIVLAFEKAEQQGLGVVSLGSKMIDPPVVKRAQKTVAEALAADLLVQNWRDALTPRPA